MNVARMTSTIAGITNSARCQPPSTKSRTNLRCGPWSRAGRYLGSPAAMPTRAFSRWAATSAFARAFASLVSGTRGRLRAASCSARLGVARPLPTGTPLTSRPVRRSVVGCGCCRCLGHGRSSDDSMGVALKITRMTSDLTRQDAVREAAASGIPSALADLGALVRIPSIAFPGFDHAEVQRSAEAVAELVRGTGLFEIRRHPPLRDPRHRRARAARGARDACRAQRPADDPALRAPRRAARRRRGAVGVAAVRADGARRPHLRPRRRRRQGGRHGAHRGAARADRGDRRRLRPRRRAVLRGRGGGGLALVRAVPRRQRRRAARRRHRRGRLGQLGRQDPGADRVAARQHPLHAARAHARPRVALRHVRRSGARRHDGDGQAARDAVGRGRRGRRRGTHRAGCRDPGRTARRRCATRPGCLPGSARSAPARSSAASGTSRRSRSPASTRRASRTRPTR